MPTVVRRHSRMTDRVFTAAVILAAALAVGTPLYFFLAYEPAQRRDKLQALSRELDARTDERQLALERWVQNGFADAATVVAYPSVRSLLGGTGARRRPAGAEIAHVNEILTLFARTQGFERVLLVDGRSDSVAAGYGSRVLAPAELQLLRAAMATGVPAAGFHRHPVTAVPDVGFATAVQDERGRTTGAVLLEADPEEWVYPVLLGAPPLPQASSEAVLAEQRGDSVVWVSPRRKSSAPPLADRRLLAGTRGLPMYAAVRGGSRFGAYRDYTGTPVFASTRRIAGTSWGLVVKVDQAEILGPFNAQMRREAAGWGTALAALVGLATVLWWNARRALELELKRGLARQGAALDQANDMVLFVGLDGRIEGANRRAEEFYGADRGLIGRDVFDLRALETRAKAPVLLAKVKEGADLLIETVHLAADGTPVPVEVSSRRVHLDGGDQIVSVIRDIRERKAAEAHILRLNRMLRTLSEIDQLMIRETDPAQVFDAACRVMVEHGGFRMAWIGRAEPDGTVRALASAGVVEGYLDEVRIRWDDTPEGRGPTGVALREGRTATLDDLGAAPSYRPWAAAALRRGYRTSGAFPIRVQGEVRAALDVYSAETGVFDAETVSLLEELARDLGFALQGLEDVAARRRAEAELRASDARLRAFFESNATGITFGDVRGNIVEANDEFLRMVGYTRDDLAAGRLRWTDLTPAEFAAADEAAIAEAASHGRCTPFEKQYVRKDGSRVWVLVGFVLLGEQREQSAAFVVDISARKKAEAAVHSTEGRYRSLFRGMLEGYAHCRVEFDGDVPRDFVCLDVNPAFSALTGLQGVAGKRATEIIPGIRDTNPELFEICGRVARTAESSQVEAYVPGLGMWLSISAFCPAPGEFAAVFENVTERKLTEEKIQGLNVALEQRVEERTAKLTQALTDLERVNKELESFAYSVSHDLRAPLRAIDGFGRMLEEDQAPRLDAEGRRLLDVVRRSTKGMGVLIDDLLAFSRAGGGEIQRSQVDMEGLARSSWESLTTPAERRAVAFRLDALPPAECDPGLIHLVWMNLLSNALKFTGPKLERVVEVRFRQEAQRTTYVVRDNGVGFDPRYTDKLFGVFQRLHSAAEFEGTGVGLALVQRIVHRHGGEVSAQGVVGEGATFSFTLPREGDPG